MSALEFTGFPKMARLTRECIITEKLDGTNASIKVITESEVDPFDPLVIGVRDGKAILAGSRTRWITPDKDNYGFAGWVLRNIDDLSTLPLGQHFGEWWGNGIQRSYGLKEKRFSLFNVGRFNEYGKESPVGNPDSITLPECCSLVPVLYKGVFDTDRVGFELDALHVFGSTAAPGFMDPEGVIVYHVAAGIGFKKTIKDDGKPKSV